MVDNSNVKTTRSKKPPKLWIKKNRASSYQAPPPGRMRRLWGLVFNIWTVSLSLLVLMVVFLTLTYFWFEFSRRIDERLLGGEVFTATAGIYSAPKILRTGESLSPQELIDYLKTAGYIERNNQADAMRSRYFVDGDQVGIEPGLTGTID